MTLRELENFSNNQVIQFIFFENSLPELVPLLLLFHSVPVEIVPLVRIRIKFPGKCYAAMERVDAAMERFDAAMEQVDAATLRSDAATLKTYFPTDATKLWFVVLDLIGQCETVADPVVGDAMLNRVETRLVVVAKDCVLVGLKIVKIMTYLYCYKKKI